MRELTDDEHMVMIAVEMSGVRIEDPYLTDFSKWSRTPLRDGVDRKDLLRFYICDKDWTMVVNDLRSRGYIGLRLNGEGTWYLWSRRPNAPHRDLREL